MLLNYRARIVLCSQWSRKSCWNLKWPRYNLRKNINCQGKTFVLLPYVKRNRKCRRLVYMKGIWRKTKRCPDVWVFNEALFSKKPLSLCCYQTTFHYRLMDLGEGCHRQWMELVLQSIHLVSLYLCKQDWVPRSLVGLGILVRLHSWIQESDNETLASSSRPSLVLVDCLQCYKTCESTVLKVIPTKLVSFWEDLINCLK